MNVLIVFVWLLAGLLALLLVRLVVGLFFLLKASILHLLQLFVCFLGSWCASLFVYLFGCLVVGFKYAVVE